MILGLQQRPLSAITPVKGAEMLNSITSLEGQHEFWKARELWLMRVLGDRALEQRAKLVATAIYFHFNYERWQRDHKLYAFPRKGLIREMIGESRSSVKRGIDDLEQYGYLKVKRRYDEERHMNRSSIYLAQLPK